MDIGTALGFGLVILATHFLEGITGFGCTVLALPFCIMLVGIKSAVPTLVILALLLALYVVIIAWRHIVWPRFRTILVYVGLGLPVGMWLFTRFPEGVLRKILAVFMVAVSLRGLWNAFLPGQKAKPPHWLGARLCLFLGGCVHGAFGSGGPLVVVYATKALPRKENFRATLCLLWLTLNSVILFRDLRAGIITPQVITLLLYALPFLAAGAWLGNLAHHRADEAVFLKIVYGVLFLTGLFMFF
jgi:uncharacterized membrane protein YfcA